MGRWCGDGADAHNGSLLMTIADLSIDASVQLPIPQGPQFAVNLIRCFPQAEKIAIAKTAELAYTIRNRNKDDEHLVDLRII
jgi:hypothetical protein